MAELDSARPTGKIWSVLLTIVGLFAIGSAVLVAMRPDLFSFGAAPLVERVSIIPPEAVVGGGQWRLVSQWQGAGDVQKEGSLYLVEFKSIPGWETPAPVVLKKGEFNALVEGAYKPAQYSEQTILTLTGATTLANRLVPELAQFYLTHIGANEVRKLPGKTADEITVQGIFYSTREIRNILIQGLGTPAGIQALKDKACDVAMAAQKMSAEEARVLGNGVPLAFTEHRLGMDAVSVVVHRDNPVQALSVDEVGRIFSGEITNWEQVGGPSAPIKLFVLRDTLGTRRFFDAFFMGGKSISTSAREVDVHAALPELVSQEPWSIGFCSITLASECREMALKSDPAAAGVLPTPQAVRSGAYPATRDMYFYMRPNTENVYALDFVRISLGDMGQAIVRKFGFVGLRDAGDQNPARQQPSSIRETVVPPVAELPSVKAAPANGTNASAGAGDGQKLKAETLPTNASDTEAKPAPQSAAPQQPAQASPPTQPQAPPPVVSGPLPYLEQFDGEAVSDEARRKVLQDYLGGVHGAERQPVVFRFEPGNLELDQQAYKDVSRVAAMMREAKNAGKTAILVGFSDSVGIYASNLAISRKRAEVVAQSLKTKGGGSIVVLAAGEEGAIERNDSRAGREANRRVELWLK
jgi:phosphate transport system substrate-binding protein